MTRTRSDYRPAPTERRRLESVTANDTPADQQASAGYELAAGVRRLNCAIAALSAEKQAELMDDWAASWKALEQRRLDAVDDGADLAAVRKFVGFWESRLHVNNDTKEID